MRADLPLERCRGVSRLTPNVLPWQPNPIPSPSSRPMPNKTAGCDKPAEVVFDCVPVRAGGTDQVGHGGAAVVLDHSQEGEG